MTGKQQRSPLSQPLLGRPCPVTIGVKLRKGQMGCFKCGVALELGKQTVNVFQIHFPNVFSLFKQFLFPLR